MPISKETISLIEAFKSPIIAILKGVKDEIVYSFNDGLSNYLDAQTDLTSEVNRLVIEKFFKLLF